MRASMKCNTIVLPIIKFYCVKQSRCTRPLCIAGVNRALFGQIEAPCQPAVTSKPKPWSCWRGGLCRLEAGMWEMPLSGCLFQTRLKIDLKGNEVSEMECALGTGCCVCFKRNTKIVVWLCSSFASFFRYVLINATWDVRKWRRMTRMGFRKDIIVT